jgi:hypothetical protein
MLLILYRTTVRQPKSKAIAKAASSKAFSPSMMQL